MIKNTKETKMPTCTNLEANNTKDIEFLVQNKGITFHGL